MKNAWNKWMIVAKKFGNIQANILLTIVYILIITPLGFLFKITGKFQTEKTQKPSYWNTRKKFKQDINWARKQ